MLPSEKRELAVYPVCYGGVFATTREAIRSVLHQTWKRIANILQQGDNIEESHFMERTWEVLLSEPPMYPILTPPPTNDYWFDRPTMRGIIRDSTFLTTELELFTKTEKKLVIFISVRNQNHTVFESLTHFDTSWDCLVFAHTTRVPL